MNTSKTIAKGRWRSSLPGRLTSALATAIRNSQKLLAKDFAMANAIPPEIPPKANANLIPSQARVNQQFARMKASDPQLSLMKNLGVKFNPLPQVNPNIIPSQEPNKVIAPVAVVSGEMVKKARKPGKKKKEVVVATVAPSGVVVRAVEVVGSNDDNNFQTTLEQYLKNKSHTKTSSLWEDINKQYSAGLKFNGSTKRWIKR
jgi:hypothetical protein